MAEKNEKKPDAAPAKEGEKKEAPKAAAPAAAKGGGGGLMTKMPVLLGFVMVLEAAVLFAGFKFLGGGAPKVVVGAELAVPAEGHATEGGGHGEGGTAETKHVEKKKFAEIPVVDFRAPNKKTGRTFLYDVCIKVMTKGDVEEKVKTSLKDREAMIKDRIRTIIAQGDPEKLGGATEPGLETLKRQVKFQLDEIVGEGMIEEVLVERCLPIRADY